MLMISISCSFLCFSGCWNFQMCTLQVSSIRASKSDDKRLSIFTGTKTLHLRCVSREDRSAWIESLLAAKELFPRVLSSNDFAPAEDVVVSTEKLRLRLLQEGISEAAIKDCESVMLLEVSELQNKFKALHYKHVMLLETLRQLEVFVLLPFSFLVHYTLLKQSLKSCCSCLRIELDGFCLFFELCHGNLSYFWLKMMYVLIFIGDLCGNHTKAGFGVCWKYKVFDAATSKPQESYPQAS